MLNLSTSTKPLGSSFRPTFSAARFCVLGTRPTDIGPLIWGIVEVQVFDSGTVHQRLWRNTALGTTNGYYKRSYNAGAWGAWDMTFMRSNLLGTVAQTGGVPTGSVIERGSNANGEYVKYADGTLICTRATLSAPNANTALGSIFRSADVAWTFPATFVNTTHLVVSGDVDDADSWLAVNTITTTGCNVRGLAGATKAAALTCRASAIGRWF